MTLFTINEIQMFPAPLPGIVELALASDRPGRVKFQGSYWPAKLYCAEAVVRLQPEQTVAVVGMEGITLLVVPQ